MLECDLLLPLRILAAGTAPMGEEYAAVSKDCVVEHLHQTGPDVPHSHIYHSLSPQKAKLLVICKAVVPNLFCFVAS